MPQFVSISSKTTPFWGHPSLTICRKAASCLLFHRQSCWHIHQIYSIDSQATNFGPVLASSRKRLRNFYHSIGVIKIVLFLRLVLKQHNELKACSKYTADA